MSGPRAERPHLPATDPRAFLDALVGLGEKSSGAVEEREAGGGECDGPRGPDEQLAADDPLQALDLLGQRRLGHVQALRRSAEVPLLGDHDEIA